MPSPECLAEGCTRRAAPYRQLCWDCTRQETRSGEKLHEHIPRVRRNPARQGPTSERIELYRRIAEVSKSGASLFKQADKLGISHGQLKHLRVKADVYGFEVSPVSHENRRGVKYETAQHEEELSRSVPRCPRCWLALPHAGCLPTITDLASSRRGDATGLETT